MPPSPMEPTDVADYREELILSLSSARKLAAANIRTVQKRYQKSYDRHCWVREHKIG